MDLSEPDAPEEDRTDSQSALDFAYWMLTFVTTSYQRTTILTPHSGEEDAGEAFMQAVMFSCAQVNVPVSNEYSVFRARCEKIAIAQKLAFSTRGALLFRNNTALMCLGDGRRVMEYLNDEYIVRFITDIERTPSYWVAAKVPAMIYL